MAAIEARPWELRIKLTAASIWGEIGRGEVPFCRWSRLVRKLSTASELAVDGTGAGKEVLDIVNLLPWQEVGERHGLVVEMVDSVVEDCRGADLSKANDDERGVGGVLDQAGSLLQTGKDGVRKGLVLG